MEVAAVHRTSLVLVKRNEDAPVMCAIGFVDCLIETRVVRSGRTTAPHFQAGLIAPLATVTGT